MIDIRNYLAVWKGLLVMAQFLPGCLLCLKYSGPRQRCTSLVVLPVFFAALLGGCMGIAFIQLSTAPFDRAIFWNPPTIAGYFSLFWLLTGLLLIFSDGQQLNLLYVIFSVTGYTLFLALIYKILLLVNPNCTPLITICYYLLAYTATHGLLVRLSRRLVLPILSIELPWLQARSFLLPLALCILLSLQLKLPQPSSRNETLAAVAVIGCTAALYLLALRLVLRITADLTSNRRFMMRMQQLEEFYVTLSQSVQQTRSYRHDLRHHLTLLRQMNRDGFSDEIESYLTHYLSSLPPETAHHYTGNYYIDALIYHFFRLAQSEGIHTYVQLFLPAALRIAPYDLCSIFGNCLENALDACRQQTGGYRFIRVQGEMIQQKIVLIFSNSFNGHIRMSEHLLSTKPGSDHGYGVQSVEYSAKRYDGQIRIDYADRVFRISIVLNQPPPKTP